jgi:uncharacterized repeat protein (TIGR03803 family)
LFASCKKDSTPSPTAPVTPTPTSPAGGTFANLLTFTGTNGANPHGDLIISGSTLYGMTSEGGTNGKGNIFSENINGSGYTDMYDFNGTTTGWNPLGDLTLVGTTLYGVTDQGGANGGGLIFSISTGGTGYTVLYNFPAASFPGGSLTLSGTMLYGMTYSGGINGYGNVFSLNTSGNTYTDIYDFTSGTGAKYPTSTILVASGTTLYGMSFRGGVNNEGCIFSISTSGTGYAELYDFNGTTTGGTPGGSLLLSGTTLYGMAMIGGANGDGLIFSVSTGGTVFTDLLDFNNTNGLEPTGSLILSGSTLYGMTANGGTDASGLIFSISTTGTGFTDLYNFTGGATGASPVGSLLLSNNVLYGMTQIGGTSDDGIVFSYSL